MNEWWNNNANFQNGLDNINESDIIEAFAALLDNPEAKKLIITEVVNRIFSLSPITQDDEYVIENWTTYPTTVDNIMGNNLWKHRIDDIVYKNWTICLKSFNLVYFFYNNNIISRKILLDIIRVVFLWKESEITDRVSIDESKQEVLDEIEKIIRFQKEREIN
jgi:hypothetical protein